ncbi:MAG: DUF58 domain-containing protein [Gemmataceae bacterium]|nr:DUF58 domain-containing protein [Gemmataceae bacterium]
MLTARGWWFLVVVLGLLLLALWTNTPPLALVCLTLLSWFLGGWLLFAVRLRLLHGRLRVEREILDERGPVDALWAGRTFRVRTRLCLDGSLPSPYLRAADRIPFGLRCPGGTTERDGTVRAGTPLELTYDLHCRSPGRVRFEGVGVQLADVQGFFHHYLFVPAVRHYRVLPPLTDARGQAPTVKRHHLLPLAGAHRHRRPGSGSELLDLRDYRPGDPPKMIAWKASARRDRLITKEFESEVPVRCTLFVDTSASVRIGPPGANALTRLVEISGGVAQAASATRDLPGLCLFDEQDTTYVRPARGGRHLLRLFNVLADAAALPPSTGEAPVRPLLPLAAGLAEEVYPELMRPDLNRVPFWLPWLWPLPTYPRRRPHVGSHLYVFFFTMLAFLPVVALAGVLGMFLYVVFLFVQGMLGLYAAIAAGLALLVGMGTIAAARIAFFYRLLPLICSARRRRHARWRKRLAALLSVRYGLAPGGLALLMERDRAFSLYLQRFLAEHQIPHELPLYDARGRYLFAAPGKVEVLTRALLRAVGKGHDNELFVLLADLLELEELTPLLSAVKVAVARHHRVLVVCPWPPGLPPPGKTLPADQERALLTALAGKGDAPLSAVLSRSTLLRFHRAYHRLRRTFARLGVRVVCARGEDPVRLILDRLERLRSSAPGPLPARHRGASQERGAP